MKLSVSMSEEDVEFLDEYVRTGRRSSRSAAVAEAVRLLRVSLLEDAYEDAWADWDASGAAEDWDVAVGDGLTDASR